MQIKIILLRNWFFLFSFACFAQAGTVVECGPCVQYFWKLDYNSKQILLSAKFNHPQEKYCLPHPSASFNATAYLLSAEQKVIAQTPVYIPRGDLQESVAKGKISNMQINSNTKLQKIQIKFVNNEQLKQARYIKIQLKEGTTFGPSEFK